MRQAHARPEQSPLEIIRAALRAAVLASSGRAALDVTGDALRRLAELARVDHRKSTVAFSQRRDCIVSALRATAAFQLTLTAGTFEYEIAGARINRLNSELVALDAQVHPLAEAHHD
ncbi:hypothetical protein [Burkholderia cepacia]|uniref:hypothetical protein n=1 Tax=Burkholderia cepacia TaxID=292 RepID=UPI001CF30FA9|nr:hypothetical protein [Burkholderia cepacia]MCA8080863.1 hypothetical protein [Burkholderia cepacia]